MVDQPLNERTGQRTVGLDLCSILFQRPVLLGLGIHCPQTVLQLFHFHGKIGNAAFVLFLVVEIFILGENALNKVFIQAPHDTAKPLDFLFAAGDLLPQLSAVSGLPGQFCKGEGVLPQRRIKRVLKHICQHIQQRILADGHAGAGILADSAPAQTMVEVHIVGLLTDVSLPVQAAAAMGAEHLAFEQIRCVCVDLPRLGAAGGLIENFLHRRKLFPTDNGLVSVAHDRPFLGVGLDLSVIHGFSLPLNEISSVDLGAENDADCPGLPLAAAEQILMGDLALHLLVVAGGEDASLVQPHGDGIEASALGSPSEHSLYHNGGNGVDDKLVAIVLRFQITVGSTRTDEFAVFHGLSLLRPDLAPNVQSVGFVYHVPQRDDDTGMGILRLGGVEVFVDRNEADIADAEILLDVVAGVDGVPAKAREIFYNNAVDVTGLNIREHLLKARTVEVCPRRAVVDVGIVHADLRVLLQIAGNNHLLGFNGYAVRVGILHRKADVDRGAPSGVGLLHDYRSRFFPAFSRHAHPTFLCS